MRRFTSWWECSSPAYSTPQLGDRIGADGFWDRADTEAAQVPGSSTTTLIPQPQGPGLQLQPTLNHSLVLGLTNVTEKGTQPCAASGWNRSACVSGTQVHRDHTVALHLFLSEVVLGFIRLKRVHSTDELCTSELEQKAK